MTNRKSRGSNGSNRSRRGVSLDLSPLDDIPAVPGAYVLVITLQQPIVLRLPRIETDLPPGSYAYCGSAYGPGGLRARLARHLRRDKKPHWHVDRLTSVGRLFDWLAVPNGDECELRAALQASPGVTAPISGFGSSDCRRCSSHLLALPVGFDLDYCIERD